MELPPYCRPRVRDVLLHAWVRLKGFVFGAGKVIVLVVVVLNFLNSLGTDGSFGNENSERSALSAVGRALVPAFEPLGIRRDNWPATVGLFAGVFAKEAVVGTLDALYSGLARDRAAEEGRTSGDDGAFDLRAGMGAALATLPANLAAVADLVADPLGLAAVRSQGLEVAAARQEVALGTFRAMASRFDGAVGAFSYLLFILLYIPCVAALGAVNREVGPAWTAFAALWNSGVAYAVAVTVYQGATFAQHPVSSAAWIGGLSALMAATITGLGIAGRVRPGRPAAAVE
jgi:ferrous iron transport protein B